MRSKTSEISRLQVYNFTRFSWYSSHGVYFQVDPIQRTYTRRQRV